MSALRSVDRARTSGGVTGGDLLHVLRSRARFLALNIASVTLLALVLSLLMPKWYSARAVLLPPTEDDSGSSMAQFLPRGFGAIRLPGTSSLADIFVAVLKSRSIADRIVERFGLVKRYRVRDEEKAVKELEGHVRFHVGDEGTIAVIVEDQDPRIAAAMANAYVEELERFNQETRTTSAKRTRAFIEERLTVANRDLAKSEDRLREYQQRRNLPAMSPADRGDADVGARLMAQKIALEVRLQVLRQSLSESSEEVRRARQELAAIERQVGGLPQAGVEIMRLWRDVKVQEQVFELLTAQLEEARIRETRDTPTVQVLDRAVPPLHKSRPKRALVVIAGFLVGVAGSLSAALLLERRAWNRAALRTEGGAISS
ncbi:MAG TPA: GNVR domain-containing protein [Candidatus Eisenbacteria bacterium]|nr:GNVR domain-containing protein [Candidatus Eisenbacteria bacterium]